MKRIAVMTTGGDAPGMNAAIRAVTRTAIAIGMEVIGVEQGYHGLLENKFVLMDLKSVGGIINKGGTILQTVRSKAFKEAKNRSVAYAFLKDARVDGMVVIGGDGSRMGAWTITKETGIPTAFVPGSIDNDVYGTDYTIGFDTAVNTGLDAIDKIRDTAASHERIFIVEVMGREHGFLALEVGLTGGAEIIMIPEMKKELTFPKICSVLERGLRRGKNSSIIVMAEGAGDSGALAQKVEKATGMETRNSVLGYIQRGGTPTAFTRRLGLTFGFEAVMTLKKLKKGESRMVGYHKGGIVVHDMKAVVGKERRVDLNAYRMNEVFSI